MNNYKLIYILGSGHCGSTLVDMIIGSSSQALSIGELAFYSHYTQKIPHKKIDSQKGYICTCGIEVQACPFWKNIIKKVGFNKNIIKNRGYLDTYKIFLNILNPFEEYKSFKTNISHNKIILDSIYQEAKKIKPNLNFLIDSSKDPRRLYELIQDNEIQKKDILVLYLIRDGFSYLNSYKKDIKTISGVQERNIFITLIEWLAVHISCRVLVHKYNINSLSLHYRDIAMSPDIYLNKIFQFIQIPLKNNVQEVLEIVNQSSYHNLHGNFVKFKKFNSISYDESWKRGLTLFEKIITKIFLYPFHRIWKL